MKPHAVARLRHQLDLTQRELARIAGCSTETIVSIENGRLMLSEKLARKISLETGVAWHCLFYNKDPLLDLKEEPYTFTTYCLRRAHLQQLKYTSNRHTALYLMDHALDINEARQRNDHPYFIELARILRLLLGRKRSPR